MYFQVLKLKKMNTLLSKGLGIIVALCLSIEVSSHGLIESPASRNQFCGVITKPDSELNGDNLYPTCADAFVDDPTGGYNFMSVLTHAEGRKVVTPLPENVCGFDSETWNGEATPWDSTIDWPTNSMESGVNEIVWNISWGPHFDDTEEFVYWITKEDFVFDPDVPLSWDDFESEPFCDLGYDHSQPDANPDVTADTASTKFYTYCTVPERSGRHIIYGEWGRNYYTYERFHGCIDAVFGDVITTVKADISATPDSESVTGAGVIDFDGSGSTGDNLSYSWSINASDDSLYNLSSLTDSNVQLTYTDTNVAVSVDVLLTVSNGDSSDTSTYTFEHLPSDTTAVWTLVGSLTNEAQELTVGEEVSLRVVDSDGTDRYLPESQLVITASNYNADVWPYELAQLVNTEDSDVAIGVIDDNGNITPVQDATSNNIYSLTASDIAGVYLNVEDPTTTVTNSCEFIINNDWGAGYVGIIRITNNTDTAINSWEVSWTLEDAQIDNLWNADFTAGTPNTASNLSWNATINPSSSVEFGFNVSRSDTSNTDIPTVYGSVCN